MTSNQVAAYCCSFLLRNHLNPETTEATRAAVFAYVRERGFSFSRYDTKTLRARGFDYLETLEMLERMAGEVPPVLDAPKSAPLDRELASALAA